MSKSGRIAAWIMVGSAVTVIFAALLPFIVSHSGERQLVDGPGVLDHGVCCVEPLYHFVFRALLPLGAVVFVVASIFTACFSVRVKKT